MDKWIITTLSAQSEKTQHLVPGLLSDSRRQETELRDEVSSRERVKNRVSKEGQL